MTIEKEQNLLVNRRLVDEVMFAAINQVAPEFQIGVEIEAKTGQKYKTPSDLVGESIFNVREQGEFTVPDNHYFISLRHKQADLSNFWNRVDEIYSQTEVLYNY